MSYSPIFIPISSSSESTKCPNCDRTEKIIKKCAHCDYEYSSESTSGWESFLVICTIIFSIWLLVTLMYWLTEVSTWGNYPLSQPEEVGVPTPSFFDVIGWQWEFVKSLKIW